MSHSSRTLHRLTGTPGRFDGAATFAPAGDALRYREEGSLRLGDGPALAASRENLWRWGAEGVAVLFADGRPVHRFNPSGEGWGTDHPCGPDLYRVRYDFAAWPLWRAEWHVEGPRKAYALRSLYARA
jgi:hypothetical protein